MTCHAPLLMVLWCCVGLIVPTLAFTSTGKELRLKKYREAASVPPVQAVGHERLVIRGRNFYVGGSDVPVFLIGANLAWSSYGRDFGNFEGCFFFGCFGWM